MRWLIPFLMMAARALSGDFVVVTSPETPLTRATPFQLQQVYLGKLDRLDGVRLVPIHLEDQHPLRIAFEKEILGNRADLESYWLKQKLEGGARPPLEVGDWVLVLAYVQRNPGYLGYIPAEHREEALARGLVIVTLRR